MLRLLVHHQPSGPHLLRLHLDSQRLLPQQRLGQPQIHLRIQVLPPAALGRHRVNLEQLLRHSVVQLQLPHLLVPHLLLQLLDQLPLPQHPCLETKHLPQQRRLEIPLVIIQ